LTRRLASPESSELDSFHRRRRAAALLGFISNVILIGVGHWYEMNAARSEYDLSDAFMIAVFVQALCVVAGGLVGNWLYQR
jgi:hypothetical protein